MICPYCYEADLRECTCIKDQQDVIIKSITKTNTISIIDEVILEKIEELIVLNELLVESSSRAYDAKFYIGRRTGINLIKQL